LQFRKDINGLRAIAVISVVLFHFNENWAPGGFAGVDVFFVISGFLMTGIIFSRIEKENFSILEFYIARANRIIPALAMLCLVMLVFGWFYLIPFDYHILGKHAGSSIGFFSNFVYWNESGYFDTASHEKWLLHTWSLSVEWQFYIIYPLFLVLISKCMSIKSMKLTVLLGVFVGFIYCVFATYKWANPAYYLLPTRAWEMMLGGVAYLYPFKLNSNKKRILECAGLILIVLSFVYISKESLWPGYLALMPVMGAFLLIQAQRNDSFITGNIIFQQLGTWSYSIYLWHWPLIVFGLKFSLDYHYMIYFLLSIILGAVSSFAIEGKNRKYLVMFFVSTLMLSTYVVSTSGASSRVDEKFQLSKKEFHREYYGGAGYTAGEILFINAKENEYDFFFSGDSYGLQYVRPLDKNEVKVAGLFDHGCLILPNYSRFRENKEDFPCSAEYKKIKDELKGNGVPLVLAAAWANYRNKLIKKGGDVLLDINNEDYYDLLKSELGILFTENGTHRKYVILGIPQTSKINVFECLAEKQLIGFGALNECDTTQDRQNIKINNHLKSISSEYTNVYFVDPNDFLCEGGTCLLITKGEPVHTDRVHLSTHGASIVVDGLINYFDENNIN